MDGLKLFHNLIYRNTQTALLVGDVSDVRIVNNTFYAETGDLVRVQGGASNVEVRNNILWAEAGYDIYVANDSQSGFFSDYNDLYAGPNGTLVYWTKDFFDILDWQADVARFDLHSIGRTVVDPLWARPAFHNLARDDYRVFGLSASQRFASPTIDQADPRADQSIPAFYQNLLLNPGFEAGLDSWSTNAEASVRTATPAPFDGAQYFFAGTVADGFAEQRVSVPAGAVADIDASDLELVFGGRIRSADETPVDRGRIEITFYAADGTTVLGTAVARSDNPTERWDLVGERVQVPVGTREVLYRFEVDRDTGTTADSYLDHGFVHLVSEAVAPNLGAYGSSVFETESRIWPSASRTCTRTGSAPSP